MALVHLEKSSNYEEARVATARLMESMVDEATIGRAKQAVIKPNLANLGSPDSGATTSVTVVDEAIKFLIPKVSKGARITVVESDSSSRKAREAFKRLGYESLLRYPQVRLVNLTKDKKIRIRHPDGHFFHHMMIPKTLFDCDLMISIGKLKTHLFERSSCILKNQFGLLSTSNKAKYHPFLSEVLYDINRLFYPDISLVDGVVAMEGVGPTDGSPIATNLLFGGTDAVSVDTVAARIMGFRPGRVPHLTYAIRRSLGDATKIQVDGPRLEEVSMKFAFVPLPSLLLNRLGLSIHRLGRTISNTGDSIYDAGVVVRRILDRDLPGSRMKLSTLKEKTESTFRD